MGSKGLKSIIMCVLILGLTLEQVQVEGKSCCKSMLGRGCYNVCRLNGTDQTYCAKLCGCKLINGNRCPSGFPKLNLLPDSGKEKTHYFHAVSLFLVDKKLSTYNIYLFAGEPDVVEYCNLGCTSSVCDNMNNGKFINFNFNCLIKTIKMLS